MTMLLDEFLDLLAKTPRNWQLRHRLIRCQWDYGVCCPITAVAYLKLGVWHHHKKADYVGVNDLGLSVYLTTKIIGASDLDDERMVRDQLTMACGLTERSN